MNHKISWFGKTKLGYWDNEKKECKKTLILLAPGANSGKHFLLYKKLLATNFRIIAPDYIGRGYSSLLKREKYLSINALLIRKLVKKLKLKEVTIVAISYGTMVAIKIGEKNKKWLKKMILIAGGEFFNLKQRKLLRMIFKLPEKSEAVMDFYEKVFNRVGFFPELSKNNAVILEKQFQETLDFEIEIEKKIKTEAVLVHFRNDIIVNRDSREKMERKFTNQKTRWYRVNHPLTKKEYSVMKAVVIRDVIGWLKSE
jgi:pimeloyl-ACP methyl ester carboxylesterase